MATARLGTAGNAASNPPKTTREPALDYGNDHANTGPVNSDETESSVNCAASKGKIRRVSEFVTAKVGERNGKYRQD